MTKRFPLSDFREPYIPEQDRQELANSVLLDFNDGSTLQCACQDAQGQAETLRSKRTTVEPVNVLTCVHPALQKAHLVHQAYSAS